MINEIVWTDDYLLGVEEIDSLHKHLCEIVNKCIKKQNGYVLHASYADLLSELIDYTQWHFECEESMMRIYKYPEIEHHTQEHDVLLKELTDKFKLIKKEVNIDSNFFYEWFGGHSFGLDKKLADFMKLKWSENVLK